MRKRKPAISQKAVEVAARYGLTPLSRPAVVQLIRSIRVDLRERGEPDTCKAVATVLNGRKIGRGWYRTGKPEFTRLDVRDLWFHKYRRNWSDWKYRIAPAKRRRNAKVKRSGKLAWYCTPGYISTQAKEFCAAHRVWGPITAEELIQFTKDFAGALTGDELVESLNRAHILRPNYTRGAPEWTLASLSTCLRLVTDGKGIRTLRWQTKEQNQLSLPIETAETKKVKNPARKKSAPARGYRYEFVKLHGDATITITETEFITRRTIRVPIKDKRALGALQTQLAGNPTK